METSPTNSPRHALPVSIHILFITRIECTRLPTIGWASRGTGEHPRPGTRQAGHIIVPLAASVCILKEWLAIATSAAAGVDPTSTTAAHKGDTKAQDCAHVLNVGRCRGIAATATPARTLTAAAQVV